MYCVIQQRIKKDFDRACWVDRPVLDQTLNDEIIYSWFALGHLSAGNYVESNRAIYWDGKTETGEQVSSGTYFYQIGAGDYRATRKMVILK